MPVVHKEGSAFLSIFPYVDFDEPNFFWNWENGRFENTAVVPKDPKPEIWHSVIAPNS